MTQKNVKNYALRYHPDVLYRIEKLGKILVFNGEGSVNKI
jgi:hypothetical protein